ncbi:hypothetical protein F5X99DRAFT_433007 [Biscogniauxia marginata]|nr:hypothetical protein F5X99DRAFT_433007 [Biscogniauxia marginata]
MATAVTLEPPFSLHLSEPLGRDNDAEKEPKQHNVLTFINYYKDPGDGSPPMPIRISDKTVRNERPMIAQQLVVKDITGEESKYTLDEHGFQHCCRESKLHGSDFLNKEMVEAEYYTECVQLLKDVTGAPRVFIFDHKTRYGPSNWHKLGENNRVARGPLLRAHVDQSYDGASIVLRKHFPDEADELLGRRYQIINIWRPIKTIFKDPLAVADATSVPDADLVAASILYPSGARDETWTIRPSPTAMHRWYFKYAQTPAEVLLIKCFDSRPTAVARRAPHSAFEDPAEMEREPRESIETRALVFYDE